MEAYVLWTNNSRHGDAISYQLASDPQSSRINLKRISSCNHIMSFILYHFGMAFAFEKIADITFVSFSIHFTKATSLSFHSQ